MGVGDYVAEAGGAFTQNGEAVQVDEPFVNPNPSHEFSWGLAEVISALLDAGLILKTLREYPFSNGFNPFQQMVELPGRRMAFKSEMPKIPLMFAICAQK